MIKSTEDSISYCGPQPNTHNRNHIIYRTCRPASICIYDCALPLAGPGCGGSCTEAETSLHAEEVLLQLEAVPLPYGLQQHLPTFRHQVSPAEQWQLQRPAQTRSYHTDRVGDSLLHLIV